MCVVFAMKRAILILVTIWAAQAAPLAHAETMYTVVLAGGAVESDIRIWQMPEGGDYVIDSVAPLEVGGTICENTPGVPTELVCKASMVAGFEVNAGDGNDTLVVGGAVRVPVTIRGGPGDDHLVGGLGYDKLIGGDGNDDLNGRGSDDLIFGGPGDDVLSGGPGHDTLSGGPGKDVLNGGPGQHGLGVKQRPRL
jgi:Ca2+-binding RTX toxin-like protein